MKEISNGKFGENTNYTCYSKNFEPVYKILIEKDWSWKVEHMYTSPKWNNVIGFELESNFDWQFQGPGERWDSDESRDEEFQVSAEEGNGNGERNISRGGTAETARKSRHR